MVDNLRPDLRIEQIFTPRPAVVLPATMPLVIFGINRQIVYKGSAGDFVGGQANPAFSFPGLEAGAQVEQDTASEEILRPHVYIQNRFGVAEVTPSYTWSTDPPTFSLSPTLSAVFEVSEGTTGEYSKTTDRFVDPNADFIEDEVAASDVIKIDGVPSLEVVSLISDDELEVSKLIKEGETYSGDLTAEDANNDRVFSDDAADFSSVKIGDLIEVNYWDIISQADGIEYSVETAGVRSITSDVDYGFAAAGVQPPITGPPYQVDIVWIKDSGGDWTPSFKAWANVTSTSFDAKNLITSPAWPGATETEENKIFEIFHYTAIDLTGGGVWSDVNGDWTADGTPVPGQRTFTIGGGNPNGINFTTLLTLPLSRYSVVVRGINDAGTGSDTSRPIFKIVSIGGATSLVVQNWDPDRPAPSAIGSGTTWEIWDDGGTSLVAFLGADITAEGGGGAPAGERCLTSTYNDFSPSGEDVEVGDVVYSDTGTALFTVTGDTTTTGNVNKLYVQNIVPGNPPSGWSDSEFGFWIGENNPVSLRVTRVVDETTLTVRNILSDPPGADAFVNLYYEIKIADSLDDVDYTIEKTVSGANLTGSVLCSFMARKNEYSTEPIPVTDSDLESLLGFEVPANPLALGVGIALQNSNFSVYALQIPEDTSDAWTDALEYVENSEFYSLLPLTQSETVLAAYRTFVELESTPDIKREKILFQCHRFERIEERTTDQGGDNAQYTKTATTTTITVNRDLSAYDVVVGDVFVGLDPVFTARIITLVSGTTTTMTVVNDNGLPIGGPTNINDWKIQSKDLTDREFATKIGAYPATIKSRRIRNIYPDQCEVVFTDDTDPSNVSGFYGGGDVTLTLPGYYAVCVEAGKRQTQRPGQALTNFPGTGIYRLLNPFGDPAGKGNQDNNDIVLNGGNWLLQQPEDGGELSALRAVTTDVSTIFTLEDSVTVQVDYLTRQLRKYIRPILGRYNIGGPFFDLVSIVANGVIDTAIEDGNCRYAGILDIFEDPDQADTFGMDIDFQSLVSAARGKIRIYV